MLRLQLNKNLFCKPLLVNMILNFHLFLAEVEKYLIFRNKLMQILKGIIIGSTHKFSKKYLETNNYFLF